MRKLRIAFSKREKGEQLLTRLNELQANGEVEEAAYEKKKEQYERLIEEGSLEVDAIKGALSTKLDALRKDLEKFPQELKDLELKSKVGEIPASTYMRQDQRIRARIKKLEDDARNTEQLLAAESAEDAGGFIDVPLDKKFRIRRPDWL